jgi:D-alanyl-D-alanine carboxypeptidase
MITSVLALKRYGDPSKESALVVFDVPTELEIGFIPKKIYCNRDMVEPLKAALTNVVHRNLAAQIKSWDGCFNIRRKRGAASQSLHSWGLAIDINAASNSFGKKPTMPPELVKCFTDAGFDWGGTWRKPDGMHFQLAKLPG